MRIAYEISSLAQPKPTGIARYIRNLTASVNLNNQGISCVRFYHKISKRKKRHYFNDISSNSYLSPVWPPFNKNHIVHGLDGCVPNWKSSRRIVTIHDIAVLLSNQEQICSGKFRESKRKKCAKVMKIADAIITPSVSTKKDILNLFKFPEEKIHVTSYGVENNFSKSTPQEIETVRQKYNISKNYLLFVGIISTRKNIARLLKAYAMSKCKDNVQLVLAGQLSFGHTEILELMEKLKITKNIKILDYVADEDLAGLYSGASGFTFPTLYEGFGLPILEAMVCGTPVLSGNRGAAPEVCSEHGVIVDPLDVDAISNGIDQLLERTTQQKEMALNYARKFTWQRCAQQTIDVYRAIL